RVWDQPGQVPAVTTEVRGELVGPAVVHLVTQRLDEGLVGHPEVLVAAAEQHDRALFIRTAGGFGRQARLSDARLPGEQHRAMGAVGGLLPRPLDDVELDIAADEPKLLAAGQLRGKGDGRDRRALPMQLYRRNR